MILCELSIYLSIYLPIYLSIYLSIYLYLHILEGDSFVVNIVGLIFVH